jgi:hypothetical protein
MTGEVSIQDGCQNECIVFDDVNVQNPIKHRTRKNQASFVRLFLPVLCCPKINELPCISNTSILTNFPSDVTI